MPPERDDLGPPLISNVRLTRLAGGVALDFHRPRVSRDFSYLVGGFVAFLLVDGAVLFLILGFAFGIIPLMFLAALFLLALLLVVSGLVVYHYLSRPAGPAAQRTRRIAVSEGVLVHTTFGGAKEVWRRDEIDALNVETYEAGGDYLLGVFLRYDRDEKFLLHGAVPYAQASDAQREELNWVAAELRRALQLPDADAPAAPPPPAGPASEAIREKSSHVRPGE